MHQEKKTIIFLFKIKFHEVKVQLTEKSLFSTKQNNNYKTPKQRNLHKYFWNVKLCYDFILRLFSAQMINYCFYFNFKNILV